MATRPVLLLLSLFASAQVAADDSSPIFVDRAAELGVDFTHFNGMTGQLYFAEHMGSGAALSDFDGDGDLDLYLGQGHLLAPPDETVASADGMALRDRLFRNDLDTGELRFTDITDESGLDARGYAMGVAVGDIDNDGDPDLYILNLAANELWRNDSEPGAPRFTNITDGSNTADPRWSAAASFFDFDADGLLDLFVGNYVEFRVAIHKQCASAEGVLDYCGPKAYQAQANRVLRNLGDGVFEDWTSRLGLSDLKRPTLGVVASDFDGDGFTDVYVANDQHANALLLNRADEPVPLPNTALEAPLRDSASLPEQRPGSRTVRNGESAMPNPQPPIVLSPDAHHVLERFGRKHRLSKNQTLGRMVALLEAIQEQEEQGRSLAFAEITNEGEVQAVKRIAGLM